MPLESISLLSHLADEPAFGPSGATVVGLVGRWSGRGPRAAAALCCCRRPLRAEGPPTRERGPRGSLVDSYEPRIRALLNEFRAMRATVIAERIGWPSGRPARRRAAG